MNRNYFSLIVVIFLSITSVNCGDRRPLADDPSQEELTTTRDTREPQKPNDSDNDDDLGCPVQFQIFDTTAKSKIAATDLSVGPMWRTQKAQEEFTVLDTKEILISYNFRWGVLSMCTPDMAMIDVDIGDPGAPDKKAVMRSLAQYAKKNGLALAIRESDRGIHAFVVSKKLNPSSEESQRIMWENFGDIRYISYSKIRGYCARIGPKVFKAVAVGPGSVLLNQQQMNQEFVSRKPPTEIIGDASLVDQALLKKLYVNDALVKIVRDQFATNYATMIQKVYKGKNGRIPKRHLRGTLLTKFRSALATAGFPVAGNVYVFDKGNPL